MTTTYPAPVTTFVDKVVAARDMLGLRTFAPAREDLCALLARVNPNYPADSVAPLVALSLLDNGGSVTVEDIDLLVSLTPDLRDQRLRLGATSLTVSGRPFKDGPHVEVTFAAPDGPTGLPLTVTVRRWQTAEEMEHWHPECADGGCECEPEVAAMATATVKTHEDYEAHTAALQAWIAAVSEGRRLRRDWRRQPVA